MKKVQRAVVREEVTVFMFTDFGFPDRMQHAEKKFYHLDHGCEFGILPLRLCSQE